jgi:hypothetical protein
MTNMRPDLLEYSTSDVTGSDTSSHPISQASDDCYHNLSQDSTHNYISTFLIGLTFCNGLKSVDMTLPIQV